MNKETHKYFVCIVLYDIYFLTNKNVRIRRAIECVFTVHHADYFV